MAQSTKLSMLAALSLFSFILGFAASIIYISLPAQYLEKPLDLFGLSAEKSSPSDRIKDYNTGVFKDKVVVYINNPYLAKFADTHSMEPVIDKKSIGIEVLPKSSAEIKAGDIISYSSKDSDDTVIHRVVKTGQDPSGWYVITKGDNNPTVDSEKVRYSQVKRVLVGILY